MYAYGKKEAECPVCKDSLGWLSKGVPNTFLCKECEWFFTWDAKGLMRPPKKYDPKSESRAKCGCPLHS